MERPTIVGPRVESLSYTFNLNGRDVMCKCVARQEKETRFVLVSTKLMISHVVTS